MSTDPLITVVVPARDVEEYIGDCLRSVLDGPSSKSVELVVVEDGSVDATAERIDEVLRGCGSSCRVIPGPGGLGPGSARNVAIDQAQGEWIVFLDGDDELAPDGMTALVDALSSTHHDLVFFDWDDHLSSMDGRPSTRNFGRRDLDVLAVADQETVVDHYLRFLIDPSVIYLAVRRDLIDEHHLRFESGLHEDVDFTLHCILAARSVGVVRSAVVRKRARPGSVVHTISHDHLVGFARAWRRCVELVRRALPSTTPGVDESVHAGTIAVVATRAREIARHAQDEVHGALLLARLHTVFAQEISELRHHPPTGQTVYEIIARAVIDMPPGEEALLLERVRSLNGRTWSCVDLQHSVFLRPDEVRTCCKRFFVDGEMRGDVALLHMGGAESNPTPESILAAKRDLHRRINAGESTPCSGCPFISLDVWPAFQDLDIRYLSMEQHSVCNLRCSYCSEEYFGGARPAYDVAGLVSDLARGGALDACHTVVWGGGEPTLTKDFPEMVALLLDEAPGATQRFLTNSTRFSPIVAQALESGVGQVVTSIDAGTARVFSAVRGRDRLDEVMATLRLYAAINPDRVTIKYIFTEGNTDRTEVRAFVERIADESLAGVFFQISADFKHQVVSFDEVAAAVQMFSGLRGVGADFVYIDELFRQRLTEVPADLLRRDAKRNGWIPAIAEPASFTEVAVWGAGQATELLLATDFMETVPLTMLVDDRAEVVGREFAGVRVQAPEALLGTNVPVILSAIQGLPLMAERSAKLGVPRDRLVRDLVL